MLWTGPGLSDGQTYHRRGPGLHPGRTPGLKRWLWGPQHRSLLGFSRFTCAACSVVHMKTFSFALGQSLAKKEYIKTLENWESVQPLLPIREKNIPEANLCNRASTVFLRAILTTTVSSVVKCKLADQYIVGCHLAFPVSCKSRPNIRCSNILDIAKFRNLWPPLIGPNFYVMPQFVPLTCVLLTQPVLEKVPPRKQ